MQEQQVITADMPIGEVVAKYPKLCNRVSRPHMEQT